MKRAAPKNLVRVRVLESQPPFIEIDGAPYVSLLWSFGSDVEVPLEDLGKLIAGTRGSIVIARRLVGAELRMFEEYRRMDAECHARIISTENRRFRGTRSRG